MIYAFPCGSASRESAHHVGDLGSIPGLGRFPGEGKDYPLQYFGLENSMDCTVLLEKEMATHSSVLACRIPGMWEPGGLPSMGSHRVGHD